VLDPASVDALRPVGWLGFAVIIADREQFVGHPAYGLQQLHDDLERFTFLLGGSDGEPLFGP
jgi:hypothetical protein